MSVAITALQDSDAIFRAICDNARSLLAADVALLVLAGPDDSLLYRAGSGPPGAIDPMGPTEPRGSSNSLSRATSWRVSRHRFIAAG